MKSKMWYFILFCLAILTSCYTETGGSYDFMSDQIGVLSFLIKNWWLVAIAVVVFVVIAMNKKNNDK